MKKLIIILLAIWLPTFAYAQGCSEPEPDQKLKLFGYIQAQYDWNTETGENTFLWNRARVGITGNIPYDFQYYVVAELSPSFTGNPFLLDAFASYNRFKWFKVAAGQFKSPFTLELQTPCHKLLTIDRSHVVVELASPLRDMGVMLFGGNDQTFVKYQLAIMNGTGIGNYEDKGGKDYVGRVVFRPLKDKNLLAVGGNFRYGTSAPSAEGVTKDDTRLRYGLEGIVKWHNLLVQGEYIFGKDEGSYLVGGGCGGPGEVVIGSKEREGWYVTAAYMTQWRVQPVFKYEYYDSDIQETDAANQFCYTTTFGINYFFNDWTRLQINYTTVNSTLDIHSQLGNLPYNNLLMIQLQAEF